MNRRSFLQTTAAAAVAAFPTILRAQDKSGSKNAVIGTGEYTYECLHGWGDLPSHLKWGETHGVAVDEAGFIYVKNNTGPSGLRHQDCIVVFDPTGRFVRQRRVRVRRPQARGARPRH